DPSIAQALLKSNSRESAVTAFRTIDGKMREIPIRDRKGAMATIPLKMDSGEIVYDFAIPVIRRSLSVPLMPPLSLESNLSQDSGAGNVYGVVQVGLTSAKMQRALASIIDNVVLITTMS